MKLGDAGPGDVVAVEIDHELHVLRVGAVFGVEFSGKGKKRKGEAHSIMVDRLDVDTLRVVPFKAGWAFETSIVDASLDVELVATASFMRALRRERHMTAGRAAAAFDANSTNDVEVDPMQRGART